MKRFTHSLKLSGCRRLVVALWAALLVLSVGSSQAQTIYYSNTGQYAASQTCLTGLCTNGVQYPSRAADADLDNYATLLVSTASAESLNLDLNGTGLAGYRAGLVVANSTGLLNIQALGTVRITTYLKTGNVSQLRETRIVAVQVAHDALLGGSSPTQLEFVAGMSFNQVKIEIGGVNGLNYAARIYYAYAVPVNTQPTAQGLLSRFGTTTNQYSTAGTNGGTVCVNTDVSNPQNAVDNDLTNYAQFSSLATVACPPTLRVNLEGTSPGGYYAGFVLGNDGLLDASVLSGLRIKTWRNGVMQESAIGLNALELTLLPNGQTQVRFRTTLPFDAVSIERVGLVSALDNLQIYYGFGIEPRAFEASTSSLSNFSNAAGHYQATSNALLCLGCAVTNPENAANTPTDASSYATMNVPVGIASSLSLKLDLTSPGLAGNRAGVVISPGSGLLDVAALQQLTVNTYDASGKLLESRSGASLLSVSLLPDGRQEVYFNTTRDFASVELQIGSGIAALANTKVFYAFADDRPTGFPLLITPPAPLPVELTALEVHWASAIPVITWKTASERASRYFEVERSAGADAAFQPVGRVEAAGTSTAPRSYSLRDAKAAAQPQAVWYYRLRQVDIGGKSALSAVVVLAAAKNTSEVVLYPNPASANQTATVQFGQAAPGRQVRLYSQLGQLLRQLPADAPTLELPLTGLAAGLYYVSVADANGRSLNTQRLAVVE